jgi:hypothetical protein
MRPEITNTVTIYEINGMKYTGAPKIDIKTHPRFSSFVRPCIDNQEYSLASDDLIRAVDRAVGPQPVPEDEVLGESAANLINQFARAQKQEQGVDLPPR